MSKNADEYIPIEPNDALLLKGRRKISVSRKSIRRMKIIQQKEGKTNLTPNNENISPPAPKTPAK
jgi:hypothetical protein